MGDWGICLHDASNIHKWQCEYRQLRSNLSPVVLPSIYDCGGLSTWRHIGAECHVSEERRLCDGSDGSEQSIQPCCRYASDMKTNGRHKSYAYCSFCIVFFLLHNSRVCWYKSLLKSSKVNVCLYSASTQTPLTRSDMDHTMLPANNTISAFTPQWQSITALWPVLIAPTHGGMARLSWPGWLVKLR